MDEAIEQLRHLLKEAKARLFHAEHILDMLASQNNFVAKNYVEKHHKDIQALRSEFEKTETPATLQDEPPLGSAPNADGRLV